MRRIELGLIGRFFGSGISGQTAVAAAVAFFVGIFALICIVGAIVSQNPSVFWQNFERCLAFMGACLAYIFGKGSAPTSNDDHS
jgi:hypothetical protein